MALSGAYELNPNAMLFGGYRAYKDEFDIPRKGPIVGATFWF